MKRSGRIPTADGWKIVESFDTVEEASGEVFGWGLFHRGNVDNWINFKLVLLSGKRVKANYWLNYNQATDSWITTKDYAVLLEHLPDLFDLVMAVANEINLGRSGA